MATLRHLMNNSLLSEEDHPNATPVITLEILSRPDLQNQTYHEGDSRPTLVLDSSSGVHFLTEDQASSLFSTKLEPTHTDGEDNDDASLSPMRSKQELLEYLTRHDGSVVCKLCGEILQSRTHWYRHKYKFHVAPVPSPAALFKCEHCGIFFKSRKGYIGHIASRHPEGEMEDIPPLPPLPPLPPMEPLTVLKQEPLDPELAIPSCELPTLSYAATLPKERRPGKAARVAEAGESNGPEWEKQRRREERLVADIIARVRRECEAAGAPGGARRGYSRRSALTNG